MGNANPFYYAMNGDLYGFDALHKEDDEDSSDDEKLFQFGLDRMEMDYGGLKMSKPKLAGLETQHKLAEPAGILKPR